MPSFNGVEVDVHAPATGDEDEPDARDTDEVLDALDNSKWSEDPLVSVSDGYVEIMEVRDGKLEIGAWTDQGGTMDNTGWYVHISIPLLPTKSLQRFLSGLSDALGNFSDRFTVKQVETKEVGSDGRVSVGTKYAGEEKRIAVLED